MIYVIVGAVVVSILIVIWKARQPKADDEEYTERLGDYNRSCHPALSQDQKPRRHPASPTPVAGQRHKERPGMEYLYPEKRSFLFTNFPVAITS